MTSKFDQRIAEIKSRLDKIRVKDFIARKEYVAFRNFEANAPSDIALLLEVVEEIIGTAMEYEDRKDMLYEINAIVEKHDKGEK